MGHAEARKTSVLIIDDEPNACRMLQRLLSRKGHEADYATDARTGLAKSQARAFDVVLLDVKLSDMNGLDVLRSLRQMRPETAIIMVTGAALQETREEAFAAGADCYLRKPVDIDELLAQIERLSRQGSGEA